jgi:tetratricopeptide (TPR) repeat protein
MLYFPEFVSLSLDWNMLLGAGLAVGAAGLASVFTHAHTADVDLETVKKRVAELEKSSSRTLEQNDELAALYATWATALFDEEGDLEEVVGLFTKAETILKATLAQGDDTRVRQQLGNVYLEWAIALNGCDDVNAAIDFYHKAIETLKPLDDSGDGDAKYDIAGIKLNLGIAYRELGELEKAKASLDESFLLYRAVEKICADDTRYYMATVSVQQGNILYEMGETLDTIVDAYNRAMRLYVEVIEDQQEMGWLERNLANVLLDRCMVTYENWLDQKFESESEKNKIIDDVLLDISRGIELLEKQYQTGNELARYDLFHGITLQGKVLCDAAKYTEAQQSLDRAINEFTDLCEGDDDVFLMQMAMAYANRAVVHLGLGNKNQGEQDCLKGSELINKLLQSDSDDEEIQELKQQFQTLLAQLK